MAKFRKKPIVIDAVLFTGMKHLWPEGVCKDNCGMAKAPHVHTLEGPMNVSIGDWIITGVNGEFYPCKPDIFDKIYDKVPTARKS